MLFYYVLQLLATVLQREKPELELRRTELLRREEEMKLQMTQLEESLLQELASARGNVLENEELIASLNKTKSSSNEIAIGLKESHDLQISLEEVCDCTKYFYISSFKVQM